MASKYKHCDCCGKKCLVTDMVRYKELYLCDSGCIKLYIELYGDKNNN